MASHVPRVARLWPASLFAYRLSVSHRSVIVHTSSVIGHLRSLLLHHVSSLHVVWFSTGYSHTLRSSVIRRS